MRNCDWTQKVSLLIDGELGPEESRTVETHMNDCLACRAAREDFLLLRRRISSYRPDVNLVAQREALQNILAAGRAESPAPDFAPDFVPASPTHGRRARFFELFALPRLNPGLVAASALVLVCLAVGLLMLRDDSKSEQTAGKPETASAPQAPTGATRNGDAAHVAADAPSPGVAAVEREAQPAPTQQIVKLQPKGAGGVKLDKIRPQGVPNDRAKIRPKGVGPELVKLPREIIDVPFVIPPRVDVEALEFSEAEVAANDVNGRAEPAPAAPSSTARHAEQAQMLLRSFRNSSASGATDLSYERGRSQELLYQNIVLRRAAARGGDSNVEATLTQLEPILLDIANLPDKPASEDVRSIKNRMERKNIVAMLQIATRD